MPLLEAALQCPICVVSVMGDHAGEGTDTIFDRKKADTERTGVTFWLMRSPKARPQQVHGICRPFPSYAIFVEPATKGGARPTTEEDAAKEYSEDRVLWCKLSKDLSPVTGKLDASATALVFDMMTTDVSEIKGLQAKGRLTPNGFLVLKGSQAVLKERASALKFPWPLNMRQRLKEEGVLSVAEDYLVFRRDEEFSSPSAAAAVVHGGHANGLIAWKNKDGKTLKEIETI